MQYGTVLLIFPLFRSTLLKHWRSRCLRFALSQFHSKHESCCIKTHILLLAERCNCIASSAIATRCRLSSLFLSSVCRVWRECIVTKRLRLGSCSFYYYVSQCFSALPAKLDYEIWRGFHDWMLKLVYGGFWLRDAISRRRCNIELK